jgi:hypothetical protein
MEKSTDEFLAIKFPNLERGWLEMVNDTVGFLKQRCSGNGKMQTLWNGGTDSGTEWTFKPPKRPRYKPPIQ